MDNFTLNMRQIFGNVSKEDMTVFTACFDEAGNDGKSQYLVVACALARNEDWARFDPKWDGILGRNGVPFFHAKDFNSGNGVYAGWTRLKRDRFKSSLEKTIKASSILSFSVAINKSSHAAFKQRMMGIKGYKPSSDYGLCFSYLRMIICENLADTNVRPKLSIVVEQGPFSDGASRIYNDLANSRLAKFRPARHADMLNGFAILPKGRLNGLDVADLFADKEISSLRAGTYKTNLGALPCRVKLAPNRLEQWYEGMLKEREHRRAHGARRKISSPS